MPKLRNGHAVGHVRDAACNAFQAWVDWDGVSPEPVVQYEVHYVPSLVPISLVLGLVWNCTDIVPGNLFDTVLAELESVGLAVGRRTYGACARAILNALQQRAVA